MNSKRAWSILSVLAVVAGQASTATPLVTHFVSSSSGSSCIRVRPGGGQEGDRLSGFTGTCMLNSSSPAQEVWVIADIEAGLEEGGEGTYIYSMAQISPAHVSLITEDQDPAMLIVRSLGEDALQKWRLQSRGNPSWPHDYQIINTVTGRCIGSGASIGACTTFYWRLVNVTASMPPPPPLPDGPYTQTQVVLRSSWPVGYMTSTFYWNVTMRLLGEGEGKGQVWSVGNWDRLKTGTTIQLQERFEFIGEEVVGALTQVGNTTFVREAYEGVGPAPLSQIWRIIRPRQQENNYMLMNVGSRQCIWWQQDAITSKFFLYTSICYDTSTTVMWTWEEFIV